MRNEFVDDNLFKILGKSEITQSKSNSQITPNIGTEMRENGSITNIELKYLFAIICVFFSVMSMKLCF